MQNATSFKRTVASIAIAGFAALATLPALAADGDGMQSFRQQVTMMADKNGMVSKKEFMAMMEKKFDAMDKSHKGMLSTDDIMRIFNDKTGA
ncbi:MAG: hypothetical protein JSR18_04450 [Proteobacteria bacterium]|nr:hypothetical protein [Pseudomonadota bacterium]